MQNCFLGDKIPTRVYICGSEHAASLKKLLEYDPYLDKSISEEELVKQRNDKEFNTIFARQDYFLKDGISMNLDRNMYYLYLSGNEDFLEMADKKLKKTISDIKRADQETEKKVIDTVETERSESEQGLGSIFG